MSLTAHLRQKLERRAERQLDVEIKRLEAELANDTAFSLPRLFAAPFKWLLRNLAIVSTLAAAATLYLGVLSYDKDTEQKREARLYSLVEILQKHAPGGGSANVDIATAAIGAMRSGYSGEKKYAFLIAFSSMPFAVLRDKTSDPVRRIASESVSDAIYLIDDYPEFQTIFAKWHSVVTDAGPGDSQEYTHDLQRVVCALGYNIRKFGFPGPSDMSACTKRGARVQSAPPKANG